MNLIISVIILFLSLSSEGKKPIFKDSFDYPSGELPTRYWSEGCPGVIKDGHLFVDADTAGLRQSTIWLDRELSDDLIIECDVHIVSSIDEANNINFMLFYSDPESKSLRESRFKRSTAAYNSYHDLNGYIFTYLSNGAPDTARFRFRDNPGFNLLEEVKGFECKAGKTYHIRITKTGSHFQFWSNGFKAIDIIDDRFNSIHTKGHFGFRTWHPALWWDNLSITSK